MLHRKKERGEAIVVIPILFLVFTVIYFIVRDTLPDHVKEEYKRTEKSLQATVNTIKANKDRYISSSTAANFTFFRVYADREKWVTKYDDATKRLDHAKSSFAKNAKPLYDKDESVNAGLLTTRLSYVRKVIKESVEISNYPFSRMDFLKNASSQSSELGNVAQNRVTNITNKDTELKEHLTVVKKDYPKKASNIETRYLSFYNKVSQSTKLFLALKNELSKTGKDVFVDYAVIGDNAVKIKQLEEQITKLDGELRTRMSHLYRSFAKNLIDMRVICYIKIGRTSWDNSSDSFTDKDYTFKPINVPCENADIFDKLPENTTVAKTRFSWGDGYSVINLLSGRPAVILNSLQLNWKENYPNRHDAAEFWVDNVVYVYWHKYRIVENSEVSETDWIKVDEKWYEQNEDNLGMDVITKPYGIYEDELTKVASPPGMAFVGDKKYGEWKQNDGGQVWHWHPPFFFYTHSVYGPGTPYYYGYNDYTDYNRNYRGKKPYYGLTNGKSKFGTTGTTTAKNPRIKTTSFAKSGGFRVSSSVRGAGKSARGKGPGGGGK